MTDRVRPSLDELGRVLAEPMRLRVLRELLGGTPLPAGALAVRIGVAPSTVSSHLARLAGAGLIQIETVGRTREARLADPTVADAIESLLRLSGEDPVSSLSAHDRRTRQASMFSGRTLPRGSRQRIQSSRAGFNCPFPFGHPWAK